MRLGVAKGSGYPAPKSSNKKKTEIQSIDFRVFSGADATSWLIEATATKEPLTLIRLLGACPEPAPRRGPGAPHPHLEVDGEV